jgi:multidrug resistance efflux pump
VSVIPKDPTVVTSPLEGAIEKVYVKPDQEVEPGTILFEMEKRDLKNQYELALRELDTAKAKLDSAIQTGFKNIDNRAEINALQMEEKEKRLKVQYTEYRLQEANVKATEKGVAIIDNPERWVGRPVSMGERIMLIGQRERVQFEVWLPVSDAIEFKAGDAVNVYLTEDPLTTLHGQVAYSSFDASMTPKQVLAYRVIADLNPDQTAPHIGSQGTAKIIGKRVSFFYYLFRKPIGFLRQSFGW